MLLATVMGLTGCSLLFGLASSRSASSPTYTPVKFPVVIGARVDDGQLIISTGRSCPMLTTIYMFFDANKSSANINVKLLAKVDQFNIDDLPNSIGVTDPPMSTPDWHDAIMHAYASSADQPFGWSARTDLTGLVDASTQHATDEFFFGDKFGWMTSAQVTARDGVDLLTVCTPTS